MPDPRCGTCANYHQFLAWEHVLVSFGDLNAGDCWHKWMAGAYRSPDDTPVFKDCWMERKTK